MRVEQIFFKNTLRNFCYMIVFDDGAIFCIDPFKALEVKDYLGDEKLTGIINTHDHCEHYSGNDELIEKYHCSVYAHEKANVPGKTHELCGGEVVYQSASWSLESVFTPGHTLSHICLLLKENGRPHAIFTGDCFFNAGVGNCHNGGDPEILYKTISEIFTPYPDELLIYPGHEYLKRNLEFTLSVEPGNTRAKDFLKEIAPLDLNNVFFINTMKVEREINSFLRLKNVNIKGSDKDVFLELRKRRNVW